MGLRWVFFDVGNVLLDEDPLTCLNVLRHAEAAGRLRPEMTPLDVLAARETRAAAGSRWPLYEALAPVLGAAGADAAWADAAREVRARFDELSPLIPGAAGAVARLARGFRLGLIANQGPEARRRLDALGVLAFFEVVALSEEVGLYKPDPDLFRLALGRAGAAPADCLMVGDRLDNDVAPAAALGLATAWVRWPDRRAKGWRPADPFGRAYLASLERLAPRGPRPGAPAPTLVVDGLGGLAAAVEAHARSLGPVSPPR